MNHFASYNEIGLHPEQCNNANNVKSIQKQNTRSLIPLLWSVWLFAQTEYIKWIWFYTGPRQKKWMYSFFQVKIKLPFSLVSDILFIRVRHLRQVRWIIIYIKLALCILLEKHGKSFYVYMYPSEHEEHERIPPILSYSMYLNTEKKWISLYV